MGCIAVNSFQSSNLHLVIWNRVDFAHHKAAMESLFRIMTKTYAGEVMPMLRPLGRPPDTYREYSNTAVFRRADIANLGVTTIYNNQDHTAHCEAWFQVSEVADESLQEDIKQEFNGIASACYFWEHINPIWKPLGDSLESCEYSLCRTGTIGSILTELGSLRSALLLKHIWSRASEAIAAKMSNQTFVPIDPTCQIGDIHGLMLDIFRDVDLSEIGLSDTSRIVDPTSYVASHMSAFAVNAVTSIMEVNGYKMYGLEEYSRENRDTTRPAKLPDRESFLAMFANPRQWTGW